MNFQETLEFLNKLKESEVKYNLERIEALAELLGHPERSFKSVHITGTNGKGSVAEMISSMLSASGYKTGTYISPHLLDIRERIKIDCEKISGEDLARGVSKIRQVSEENKIEPSFFEVLTATAFNFFAEQGVEFAVAEVGMGGRLDATNILTPMVAVITNVELEHEKTLGNSVEKIALEKCGVLKEKARVVSAEKKENIIGLIKKECAGKNCEALFLDKDFSFSIKEMELNGMKMDFRGKKTSIENLELPFTTRFEAENTALAIAAVDALSIEGISRKSIAKGLANLKLFGRFTVLREKPLTIIDSAHNPAGFRALAQSLWELSLNNLALVMGVSSDKNFREMAEIIAPFTSKAFVSSAAYRGLEKEKLAQEFKERGIAVEAFESPVKAFNAAMGEALNFKGVLVAGSIYFLGEVLQEQCVE